MNKTIYIRDEDVAVWDRAKEFAGEKLSPIIVDGLRRYISLKEQERRGFERIEVQFRDSSANDLPTAKAFYGRWLFSREEPLCITCDSGHFDEIPPYYKNFAVAQTAKNRLAVLAWREFQGDTFEYTFSVYEDLDEIKNSAVDRELKAAVMEKIGVTVEELDI